MQSFTVYLLRKDYETKAGAVLSIPEFIHYDFASTGQSWDEAKKNPLTELRRWCTDAQPDTPFVGHAPLFASLLDQLDRLDEAEATRRLNTQGRPLSIMYRPDLPTRPLDQLLR